ncbi:integrin alpha-5-like isoform X1 [Scylla paramamosain]|uniref:integrin alpha-5-like isoform X1 n=1 Tax=Scylla paramamosain TaxID=85552 RepID=UPI0030836D76
MPLCHRSSGVQLLVAMAWFHLTRGRETRPHVACVVVMLATWWLVAMPVEAGYLQVENPLGLQTPSNQKNLHFGFSLSHYTSNNQRWLLVGAPKSNASEPDVKHSGGLYKCLLSESNEAGVCEEMLINFANQNSPPWAKSNNTDQGLGFSLASDGEAIVVCAPQWYAERKKFNERNYLPVGMCFAAKSPTYEFKGFSPPFDGQNVRSMSYLNTGSCQFGISAAHLKAQNTFALGAPGCWTWRGDTWEVGLAPDSDKHDLRHLGKQILQDGNMNTKWENSYYLGYSVASFKFAGKNGIVSSIPRITDESDLTEGEALGPSIVVLTQNSDNNTLKVSLRISPSKVNVDDIRFAFFGYSLATLDMNGDGLEDLVVGAPFYNSSKDFYDQGAIFIYMQIGSEYDPYKMEEEDNAPQRKGSESFSRFGSCLAAIGDLDGDGYEDLAVGAPFMTVGSDEDAGTGVVYIYMGSEEGLGKDDTRQMIKAAPKQFGFGSSIAQQLPSIEGQGYDLAIGAYGSDTVLVFKSKEVVDVIWSMTFIGKIDFSKDECICEQFLRLCPCIDLEVCLMYHKKNVKYEDNIKLGFNITLSTVNDELFFSNEKTELQEKFEVEEDENKCKILSVLAKPGIEEIRSFTIMGHVNFSKEEKRVIIDRHSVIRKSEDLPITIHCNASDISGCQSDVIFQYDILDNYVLMSSQSMKIHFKVKNQGETAYDSKLNIRSNDVFKINNVENDEVACEENIKKEIECKLGRLDNNAKVYFNLSLIPTQEFLSSLDTHAPFFNMTAEVTTLSALSNPDTAIKQIKAPIDVQGSLQLIKQPSQPGFVYFNSSSYYKSAKEAKSEEEIGPDIKHTYKILNANKFSIYEADLTVHWPHTIDGKYFLYLMENLSVSEMNHTCHYPSGLVDPFNLKDDTQKQGSQTHEEKTSALIGIGDKSPEYKEITCSFGEIPAGEEVTVSLKSRLVFRTLKELELGTSVKNASSFVDLQITKMPLNHDPPPPSSSTINTKISYQNENPDAVVPVWLYIVSTLGGLLLLGIIVVILWKCGFFKRNRAQTPDNVAKNEEEHLTEEGKMEQVMEQEEEQEDIKTPVSPMLKETESAAADFEFHRA